LADLLLTAGRSNNRIARIDSSVPECLKNLKSLVLTNNHLKHLSDIDVLAEVRVMPGTRFIYL
jgi:Leucine-rich repeat (LRR) protein